MRTPLHLVAIFSLALAAPALAQHGHGSADPGRAVPPLFDDLGTYHREVTTTSPSVQAYFDQGLRLLFAFNLEEAQRSFTEATARDPGCAMCFWGLGMSLSPHYNLPGVAERTAAGARAVAAGLAVAADKPPVEKDLLAALARRLSDPAPTTPDGFAELDRAYADAMESLAAKYPDDLDIRAYTAEALMNLRPWQLWEADGSPAPGTTRIVDLLESVLAAAPDHPGANHMLIHALEASPTPERAEAAARRIAATMPGAAHIVHMPAHIWAQLGRWSEAADANRRAIEVDRAYVARSPAATNGFYGMYYVHNYQFLWWAACQTGRYAEAIENARAAATAMPDDVLRAYPGMDLFLEYPIWTQIRFARWAEALAEPGPAEEFAYARSVWHAARGIAFARLGQTDRALEERSDFDAAVGRVPGDLVVFFNPASRLLGIARDWLQGEIARSAGDVTAAVASLRAAFEAEGTLVYDEPADWYVSTGPTLGDLLLQAGRTAEAEEVFRRDLERYAGNGWALAGLAVTLAAGDDDELASVRGRFLSAWKDADTPPPFGFVR